MRRSSPEQIEFARFYRVGCPQLIVLLSAMLDDQARVRWAVADAFARAWQQWPSLRSTPYAASWVRRTAVAAYRSPRGRARTLLRGRRVPHHPRTNRLFDALSQLPEVQRTAWVLHVMGGLPAEQIAHEEAASAQDVRLRLDHAQFALARRMGWDSTGAPTEHLEHALPDPPIPPVTSVFRRTSGRRLAVVTAVPSVLTVGILTATALAPNSLSVPAAVGSAVTGPGTVEPVPPSSGLNLLVLPGVKLDPATDRGSTRAVATIRQAHPARPRVARVSPSITRGPPDPLHWSPPGRPRSGWDPSGISGW